MLNDVKKDFCVRIYQRRRQLSHLRACCLPSTHQSPKSKSKFILMFVHGVCICTRPEYATSIRTIRAESTFCNKFDHKYWNWALCAQCKASTALFQTLICKTRRPLLRAAVYKEFVNRVLTSIIKSTWVIEFNSCSSLKPYSHSFANCISTKLQVWGCWLNGAAIRTYAHDDTRMSPFFLCEYMQSNECKLQAVKLANKHSRTYIVEIGAST